MGAEGEGEADAVLDECIASCRELGMGLDDIERAMSRKIKRLKYDEARERGEVSARIIDFREACRAARRGRDSSRLPPCLRLTAPNDVPQVLDLGRSSGQTRQKKRSLSDERRFRVAPDVSTEVVGERARLFGGRAAVLRRAVRRGAGLRAGRWRACDRPRDPRTYHRSRVAGASCHRLLSYRSAVGARGGASPRAL